MQQHQPQAPKTQDPDELLTSKQAAALLGISPGTLEVWRSAKRYPLPYTKIGTCVRYQRSALMAFIASRTVGGQ